MKDFVTFFHLTRHRLWIPVVYLGAAVLFFLPTLITGRVALPLENVYGYADSLWATHRQASVVGNYNFTLQDLPNYYYPYMDVGVPALRHGTVPLWNPYIYSGMPFMAAHQPALLYPLNWIGALFGPHWIYVVTAVARLFLLGWGMHLFMRRFGVRNVAALWSGISFQLCSASIVWLHFGIHNVLAFLPLALYATERLLFTPRGRWFLLLTACLACQFLGGHPETSTLFALVWVMWTLFRIPLRRPTRALLLLPLAVVAALGLTLPQLLPTVDLVMASGTLARRPHTMPIGTWGNLRYLLLLINPYLSGTPLGNRYWSPQGNYNEYAVYMGFLTIPLVLVGVLVGRPRRIVWFWVVMAVVSLGLRFPLPGLAQIYGLRLLQVSAGIRFSLSWSLAAAVLGGFGFDALLRGQRKSRLLAVVGTAACATLLVASVVILSTAGGAGSVLGGRARAAALAQVAAFYRWDNLQLAVLIGLALIGSVLLVVLAFRRNATPVPALLLLIMFSDLVTLGSGYNGSIAPRAIFPPTPLTQELQAQGHHFRIGVIEGHIMPGNASMTQRLDNALGNDDLVSLRYLQFANGSNNVDRVGRINVIRPQAQRFFDIANVEFVFTTRTLSSTEGQGWTLWRKDGDTRVYRNPTALPRAYAVPHVQSVAPDRAIRAVYAPSFDPRQTAVIEEPVQRLTSTRGALDMAKAGQHSVRVPAPARHPSPSLSPDRADIVAYAPERVDIAVTVAQPELVVLGDSYAAGWEATVDGVPAHIYRTNAVYRGVFVEAGRHHVIFRYMPKDVRGGSIGAAITAALCLLGAWLAHIRRQGREMPASAFV